MVGGAPGSSGEPRALCPGTYLPFMVLCDRGPPTMERLGAPDQGADPRAQLAVGSIAGDQTNILPLNLTLFLKLNLLTLSYSHSITDQCIEHELLSRSVAIRLNSYNAPLCFENRYSTRPLVSRNHRFSYKPMSARCSLNTLGGKPFVSGSASIIILYMILFLYAQD